MQLTPASLQSAIASRAFCSRLHPDIFYPFGNSLPDDLFGDRRGSNDGNALNRIRKVLNGCKAGKPFYFTGPGIYGIDLQTVLHIAAQHLIAVLVAVFCSADNGKSLGLKKLFKAIGTDMTHLFQNVR